MPAILAVTTKSAGLSRDDWEQLPAAFGTWALWPTGDASLEAGVIFLVCAGYLSPRSTAIYYYKYYTVLCYVQYIPKSRDI